MREKIHFTQLGATLFVPATHKNIHSIISGQKYPNLKSVVIDTEDGIDDDLLDEACEILKNILLTYKQTKLLVFVRPRNAEILKEFLSYENIDKIDAFILPKFSLDNSDSYLDTLSDSKHYIMPSIEGKELFNTNALVELKDKLEGFRDRVILLRFGLEDMLRQLSMKRECADSIFDLVVSASVLGNFLAIFKSAGYAVSGGVYPCFSDIYGFIKDSKRDLKEGLFSKTIIHPSQIDALHNIYKVSQKELNDANKILENEKGIINLNGSMGEGKTMSPYSELIKKRSEIYGVRYE